jgi:peptidoglycan-associated lipoprotein
MNTKINRYALLVCAAALLTFTGCASKKISSMQVVTNPAGASVLFDGKSYSNTPTVVDVPKDGMDHYLFLKKEGCEEARKVFRNNQYPPSVVVTLDCGQGAGSGGAAGTGTAIKDESLSEGAAGAGGAAGGGLGDSGLYPDVRTRFVQEDVFFAFDSAALSGEARDVLRFKAKWLQENPGVNILIEGHTDERGTGEYNLALGERRALTARDFLVNLGISPERIRTVSYGEERPADPGHDAEAWARNRRAHFVIEE